MRSAIMLTGFTLALGVTTMSEQGAVTADEPKKDEKYPEKLKYREWDEQGKKFLKEQSWTARRKDGKDGIVYLYVPGKQVIHSPVPKSSEFVDEKGDIWVLQRNCSPGSNGECQLPVKKKP